MLSSSWSPPATRAARATQLVIKRYSWRRQTAVSACYSEPKRDAASPNAHTSEGQRGAPSPVSWLRRTGALAASAAMALALATTSFPAAAPAGTTGPVNVGGCVLSRCQASLARCVGDAPCLKNLVCLNSCTGERLPCIPSRRKPVATASPLRSLASLAPTARTTQPEPRPARPARPACPPLPAASPRRQARRDGVPDPVRRPVR